MIEQDIQALTAAIRDLIATLQERPASAPVAEVEPPVAPAPVKVVAPAEAVAPAKVEPPAAPAHETKRRGRPPKTVAPQVEAPAEERPQQVDEAEPEVDDFDTTEVIEEVVTVDTVRAAIRDIIIAGGKDREDVTRKHIVRILAQYNNAKTLPELPAEVFPKVLAAIRAIPV